MDSPDLTPSRTRKGNEEESPYASGSQSCTRAATLDDLMRNATVMVLSDGVPLEANRGSTIEVIGAHLELTNPRSRLSRTETRRKIVSALAELCWYLNGTNDGKSIQYWIPQYDKEMEADGTIHGAYGPRLFDSAGGGQFSRVIEMLRDGPRSTTRRAVISILDRHDTAGQFKNIPCTCTLQFFRRGDLLHLLVNMRSNDVYLGLPHDVFAFTMLQEIVAREVGVEPGRYLHVAGSLHLYDHHIEASRQFLDEGWQSTDDPMRPMPQGSQLEHIDALLRTEAQLRTGIHYADLELPSDPYWADLGRLMALHVARTKRPDEASAKRIVADLDNPSFRDFVRGVPIA